MNKTNLNFLKNMNKQNRQFTSKSNQFFVLTGGPSVGKTSLIEALSHHGFKIVPEDARRIIKEQIQVGGDALPWQNKQKYASLMLEAALKSYSEQKKNDVKSPVFFDRGHLDSICYMKMEHLKIDEEYFKIVRESPYQNVFILPPWKEIYTTDSERKQSWEEVLHTHEMMKQTYIEFGYSPIEVPKMSVNDRLDFVLKFLEK